MIHPQTHFIVIKKRAAGRLNAALGTLEAGPVLARRVVAAIQEPAVRWRRRPCQTGAGYSAAANVSGVPVLLWFAVALDDDGLPRPAPDGKKGLAFLTDATPMEEVER